MNAKAERARREKRLKKSDYLLLKIVDEANSPRFDDIDTPTYDDFMDILTDVVDYVNEETDVDMPVTYTEGNLSTKSDKVGKSMNRLIPRHLEKRDNLVGKRPKYCVTQRGREEKLTDEWLELFNISTDYKEAIEEALESVAECDNL